MEKRPTHRRLFQALSTVFLLLSGIVFVLLGLRFARERDLFSKADPAASPSLSIPSPTAPAQASAPTPTPHTKSAPVHLYFPSKRIDMEIQPVEWDEDNDNRMETIDSPYIAAWYEPGPAPGDDGNALLNGHVRWKGEIGHFSAIKELDPYAPIVTRHENGDVRVFYVVSKETLKLEDVPSSVMSLSGERRVTLITCDGEYDRNMGTLVNRCIVIAKLEQDIPDFDPAYRYQPDADLQQPDGLQ